MQSAAPEKPIYSQERFELERYRFLANLSGLNDDNLLDRKLLPSGQEPRWRNWPLGFGSEGVSM